MTTTTPLDTKNLAGLYDEPLMDWSRAAAALGEGALGRGTAGFLGTVRPDGRPHVAAIGAAIHDGVPYFTSGPGARKAKNIAADPRCTLALRLNGLDLSLEGEAHRVTDHDTLDTLAALYAAGSWPAEREGDAITAPYSAQSAGPGPWNLYRFTIHTAFGVATSPPHGASRWRF